ncbi:uncharacterized protein LOC143344863 [Colletes latitarsis]|uniref:uncharacterized protein LOC143344863 n=1 Tax=Colletes latitarsis TaxID=2605962 RepID=UPI004036E1C3
MDDINARREARRRKILENSENRLLKLTGRNSYTQSEDKCNNDINDTNVFKFDDIWNDIQTTSRNDYDDIRTENIHNTPAHTKLLPLALLTNRINYVLLAFFVNILFLLELDYIFGKTITIPYLPIVMARLYSCKNTRETQYGSLLNAVLILCNIKPNLIYQFKKFVTILHIILGDLALYIFSFTLIYYIFS